MNNYEYIIASLPVLSRHGKGGDLKPDELTQWIRSQCSSKDNALISLLLKPYGDEPLDADFYAMVLSSRNPFIREWFAYDLMMRNAKVRWLNGKLGRPAEMDVLPTADPDSAALAIVNSALETDDILGRERSLDDLLWSKATELTSFSLFDINVILAFLVKLQIVSRWLKLDEASGRERFRQLVEEVRGTFNGVNYD